MLKEKIFYDVHVHTSPYNHCPRPSSNECFAKPEELLAGYDEIGCYKAAILPEVCPECAITLQSPDEILALCEKYGGRFVPFCNADPRMIANSWRADFVRYLKFYRDHGCRGVGEVSANLHFLDPLMQNLFACVQEVGLPLTFHIGDQVGGTYGIVDEPGLPELEETMRRFPELKFFGHSQCFWAEISVLENPSDRLGYPTGPVTEGRIPQLMRKYPNLHGDLSAGSGYNALARDRAYAAKFLTEFQDRLMFGTDICQPSMPDLRPLAKLLLEMRDSGEISETVFRKVARENAIRLLGE